MLVDSRQRRDRGNVNRFDSHVSVTRILGTQVHVSREQGLLRLPLPALRGNQLLQVLVSVVLEQWKSKQLAQRCMLNHPALVSILHLTNRNDDIAVLFRFL